MSRTLFRFHGGLHLPEHKEESNGKPIMKAPIPCLLVLPLQQNIGEGAKPIVKPGEKVLKGQVIARPDGFVGIPLHAPTSGRVVAIEPRPVPHVSGLPATCIVIETDGEEQWSELKPIADYTSLDPSTIRNLVRDAGIVGLGGAGFPSFIKLNPGARTSVDVLILNGAECEPYITCDDRLMRERADEVIGGMRIMAHAVRAQSLVIGVEENKPEAIHSLREAIKRSGREDIEVVAVPTIYPTGGEKQLIKTLTGKEVRRGGLPIELGVVCHNVATAAAVYRAVTRGEPLLSKIVTVTGGAAREPQNIEVLLGTPVREAIEFAGGLREKAARLLMGGPMMGLRLFDDTVPVVKTTNCLLAQSAQEAAERGPERPCIRCGACAQACPVGLLPQQLYWHGRAKDFDKAQDYHLFDCIECGCCSYVCPSNIPLVHYFRFTKTEVWSLEREKKKSAVARQRHENRQARIEQEKAERAARLPKKPVDEGSSTGDDEKRAAIQAAMDRVKAKKAEQQGASREQPIEAVAEEEKG